MGSTGCRRDRSKKGHPGYAARRAVSSRSLLLPGTSNKARKIAAQLGIRKAYGSYEEMLADPDVEAVYIPLPNHLHVPWSIKAAEAGKHVLCEKPISLTVEEAISLLKTRERTGVKIQEAFMVRTHPQWNRALDLVRTGKIGPVRSVMGFFSYDNRDRQNIRNIFEYGGGGLMDIGCYLVYTSRLIFGEEPTRVSALIEEHPEMRTDVITSPFYIFLPGNRYSLAARSLCRTSVYRFSAPGAVSR